MDWGSERGLFYVNPDAARGAVRTDGETWKNFDELRLKDEPILLIDPRPGMTVLEVGSGNGANLVYCGLQGATVHGFDLNAHAVAVSNEKLAILGIDGRAEVADGTQLPCAGASADAVLSSDFHEHLTAEQQVAALREAWRVLKPGGVLAIKTPNLAYLTASLWFKRAQALRRGESPRGLVIPHSAGTDDPQHIGLLSRPTLAAQLEQAGFDRFEFHYAPLRRFGRRFAVTVASTEIPILRDLLCEDLLCRARKPIAAAHFPD